MGRGVRYGVECLRCRGKYAGAMHAARRGVGRIGNGMMHHQNEKALRRETQGLEFFGGRYWDRTSDPCRVKAVLYR